MLELTEDSLKRFRHSVTKFPFSFSTFHVKAAKFCEKRTAVCILIGKLCVGLETYTIVTRDSVQSMVANSEAPLSNACHRNAGTTKTFSLTTFRYRSL